MKKASYGLIFLVYRKGSGRIELEIGDQTKEVEHIVRA